MPRGGRERSHEVSVAAAFGKRLRELRAASGLSQAQLARKCEPVITAPAYYRYETGTRLPTWEVVVRLARALGVATDEFRPDRPAGRSPPSPPVPFPSADAAPAPAKRKAPTRKKP